jgi:hypothetical protein
VAAAQILLLLLLLLQGDVEEMIAAEVGGLFMPHGESALHAQSEKPYFFLTGCRYWCDQVRLLLLYVVCAFFMPHGEGALRQQAVSACCVSKALACVQRVQLIMLQACT